MFYFFVLIVSVTPFISKPDFSRASTILMISSIFLFEIIGKVLANPKKKIWVSAFAADATAVNHNRIKMRLANSVSTFFINGKPTDIHGQRKLRNSPSLIIFLEDFFNKNPVFSKELITFTVSFISLFL